MRNHNWTARNKSWKARGKNWREVVRNRGW